MQSDKLSTSDSLRIGLIAYRYAHPTPSALLGSSLDGLNRDHPPQDNSYVTNSFAFTSDVGKVKESLKGLYASGGEYRQPCGLVEELMQLGIGGDGPEAVTAGLKAAMELEWRPAASKMAVLIADAPPHGIGE